jgi:hypothetical protein
VLMDDVATWIWHFFGRFVGKTDEPEEAHEATAFKPTSGPRAVVAPARAQAAE